MINRLPDGPPDNPTGRDRLDEAMTPIFLGCAVIALLLIAGLVVLVTKLFSQQPVRTYWPVSVDSLATGHVLRTHVQTTGRVTLVRHEADGDIHLKLVGQRGFVVLEIIPGYPLKAIPIVGQRIRAYGITRWDGEHKWQELHPLEKWEPAK